VTVSKRSFRAFRAPAALTLASLFSTTAAAQIQSVDEDTKDDIVVTASGRAMRAQDVPYNLSVLTSKDIELAGVTDLAGLARQVPGMVFTDLGARSNGISNGIILRGLNGTTVTGATTPILGNQLVSIYIDSVPLFANLKIIDVERLEVLRGPQGTLYGAGSIGGTVRFIHKKPDPSAFSGDVQAKLGAVTDASKPYYSFDAVINLPVSSNFAVRIGGGYEKIPGVIDALNLQRFDANGIPLVANPADYFNSPGVYGTRKDVDDADMFYVRGAALLNASDAIDVMLSVQHQETRASDYTGENPRGPRRTHTRFRTSPSETDVTLYALEVSADVGFATFTSSTSYSRTAVDSNYDATNYGIGARNFYAGFPRIASNSDINYVDENLIEELRLVSESGGDWDWVVGAYHSNFERNHEVNTYTPGWQEYTNRAGHPRAVAALGDPLATFADFRRATIYPNGVFDSDLTYLLARRIKTRNTAVYGELSYHITPSWNVTGGGRFFWVENDRRTSQDFPMAGPTGGFVATANIKESDHIFKVNTSYEVSRAAMIYATWSQGFREGGSNGLPLTGPYATSPIYIPYDSDFANNYEIGIKGSLGGGTRYSAALYKVVWDDMQVQISVPGTGGVPGIVNGGKAVSQGLESEANVAVGRNLDIALGYTYTDAKLTQDFTLGGFTGHDGDWLPGVPKHLITAGATYTGPEILGGGVTFHADAAYRSKARTALNSTDPNYAELTGFTTVNASVGWQGEHLRARLYVTNLTDATGATAAALRPQTPNAPGDMYFIQRPRTIGLNLGYSW
jgi:outer membrane receptor protein involved in Fe transport